MLFQWRRQLKHRGCLYEGLWLTNSELRSFGSLIKRAWALNRRNRLNRWYIVSLGKEQPRCLACVEVKVFDLLYLQWLSDPGLNLDGFRLTLVFTFFV